jgi:hypothetical protein
VRSVLRAQLPPGLLQLVLALLVVAAAFGAFVVGHGGV